MKERYLQPGEVDYYRDEYAIKKQKREEASERLVERGSPTDLLMSFFRQYQLERAGKKLSELETRAATQEIIKQMELSNEHEHLKRNLAGAIEALRTFEQEKLQAYERTKIGINNPETENTEAS